MKQAVLQHLVCPDTLSPMKTEIVEADGEDVLAGTLSFRGGQTYTLRDGIPDFVSDEVAQNQTVRSFSQKWARHHYYREHTRKFYTDWFLQRYGFLALSNLQSFLRDAKFVLDAGTGSGRDAVTFAELSSALVFGADTARSALEVARRDVKHPRISFVQADLNRLPFPVFGIATPQYTRAGNAFAPTIVERGRTLRRICHLERGRHRPDSGILRASPVRIGSSRSPFRPRPSWPSTRHRPSGTLRRSCP